MERQTFRVMTDVGVYAFPFPFGEHLKNTVLVRYMQGDVIEAYTQEIYHPQDGYVWLMLPEGEGFILKRHRFASVAYLI